ncbi:hypothetical protein FACS1894137_08670 [Spirochaetia bacterium]|nr:hypothetical protein FACS1894137_08670 [Spirochaetia bacterium]
MNRNLKRFFCGLGMALFLLASYAVPPPVSAGPRRESPAAQGTDEVSPVKASAGDDVWTLLETGDFNAAQKYFLGQIPVNSTDERGRTPLHIAAQTRNPPMTAFFIAQGATMDLLDRENHTPLSDAVESGDAESARLLIEAGADLYHPQPRRQTPAAAALALGGGFLRTMLTPAALDTPDIDGRPLLHQAAVLGNASAAGIIADEENIRGVQGLNRPDREGKTALDLALERTNSKAHMETAEQLILAGAFSANPLYTYLAPAIRSSNYNIRIGDGIAPLHFAAREGYTGLVDYLLDKNVDINAKNAAGTTPLHEAARAGNIPIMERLISRGADVNARDAKGNSPLHIGIPAASHEAALILLLRYGADPNLRDEHGESPLHIILSLDRPPALIERLLAAGADVSIRNIDGKTPLHLAVQKNRISSIGLLIRYKSDIFAVDTAGSTPFDLALRGNRLMLPDLISEETTLQSDSAGNTVLHLSVRGRADKTILNLILDKGALVNARNKAGDTSLHIAVREDLEDAGVLLLSRGADIFANNAKGESPLYLSFPEKIPPGKVREWMINPYTISARDSLGNSMLHYAVQWKLDRHILLMVQKGIPPDVPNSLGEPPLFIAIKGDSRNTVLALLSVGANIEVRDSQGNSPLHAALRWNAVNAAQALISRGANINAHALNGRTPLHDSLRGDNPRMDTLIAGNGADLEARDNEGNTPFMEAILTGNRRAAERLAALGADPSTRNNRGDTPLHIAVAQDRADMAGLLLGWGAKIHAKNILGKTPFQIALGSSPRMVSILLTKDWIGVPDDAGHSPLHIAVLSNAGVPVVETMISLGARVGAIDADGKTPLRLALEQDKWETAKLLSDAGSNVFTVAGDGKCPAEISLVKGRKAINATFGGKAISARDPTGNTILHYAARMGTPDQISLLIELGANKSSRNISFESPGDVALKWRREDIAALLNG